MTAVTVDLADLETIVFASGAIKTIESTLAARRNDPFVRPYLDFTEAHNRLSSAMRDATRAEAGTLIPYNEPLNKEEANALDYVRKACDGETRQSGPSLFTISPEDKAPGGPAGGMSVYDRLAAKGLIKIGQRVTAVVWAGEGAPSTILPDPDRGYAATITDRGRKALTAWEESEAQKAAKILGLDDAQR